MTDPWKLDAAFEPMYTDKIKVTLNRGNQQTNRTLDTIVFDETYIDPLYQNNVSSEVSMLKFCCKPSDWTFVKTLQAGDVIEEISTSSKYKVSEVKRDRTVGVVIMARTE